MTLSLGAPIGDYTVIEHVGAEGTTAEVYRARDERHDRFVALKLLPGTSEQNQRETVAVATLDHPNIVATFDVIEFNGRLCLIQEWIDGRSLAADLRLAGQLSVQEVVQLGRNVASALYYAHQHNILHRDIKPSNVLRTVEGTYKLVDFGALGQLQVETAATMAGEIAGTPLYMSPEQITGAPQTSASDLFGLGLLLYRCLHGHLPDETADSYVQLASSRVRTPISVPSSPLQGLLERCLALDPAQRPQSAAEVLTALDQVAALPPPHGLGADRTSPAAPKSIPRRLALASSWTTLVALAVTITLLVAVVGLVIVLATAPPPPASPASVPVPSPTSVPPPSPSPTSVTVPGPIPILPVPVPPPSIPASDPVPVDALLNPVNVLLRIYVGLAIACVAFTVSQQVRRRLTNRAPEAERKAATILFGVSQRDELTRSLMFEVDQVVRNLNALDARFLGMTVVAMIREYEEARESSERQAALLNVVVLMEKLQARFSPWPVRHKDAIATGVAVVGALVGVAGVVSGFLAR